MTPKRRSAQKDREEALRLAFEATGANVWDWNIATGEVYFTDQWLHSLGYARAEIVPTIAFWQGIVHPDDWPRVAEATAAYLEGRTAAYECEYRLRTKSGEYCDNLDRGKVVQRDAGGRPLRMVGTDTDITDRRRVAATNFRVDELRDAQAALFNIGVALTSGLQMDVVLRTILDQCRQVLPVDTLYVALYHPASSTCELPLFWDQGVYRSLPTVDLRRQPSLTQVVIERSATLYLADMHDPATAAAYPSLKIADAPTRSYAGTPLLMRGQVIGVISIQQLQPNAYTAEQIRLFEMIAAQAAVAVENAGLYAAVRQELAERTRIDQELHQLNQQLHELNTQLEGRVAQRTADLQSALDELRHANRLKDEFLAMISHELRTPITGIISMSELLEAQISGLLTARQVHYVQGIVASGDRLLNVVNAILNYTHLIAGKVQLQAERSDLAYLLSVCAASLQRKLDDKQQSLQVVTAPTSLALTGDPIALAEVLKRVLDNAIKFTPQGGKIGLEAHGGSDSPTVHLVVWDTGVGIARDQIARLGTPFRQVDGSLTRSHEGLGLGLAYVYAMVRLMGGTVSIESTPSEGSRFTITLPASIQHSTHHSSTE